MTNIWYPYAQMKTMDSPIKIKKANNVYLYTEDDKKLIDSISSWWCSIHGYNNQEINDHITENLKNFAHIMLAGLTHDNAENLAKKLSEVLGGNLNHVFFADSGSVGVEVALKIATQYFRNLNIEGKTKFISLKNSYHGDTWKAMEVGDDESFSYAFSNMLTKQYHINPNIKELEEILKTDSDNIAAFIVEPLLQCAGGFIENSLEFLAEAKLLCEKYNVLLIFDEVAVGFGRTGNMFVSNRVAPDIVILGKGLTGGYVGHSATVANDKVFESFYDDDAKKAFMHGPTFMGNNITCAIALKSLEIFEREDYLGKIKNIENILNTNLKAINSDKIKSVRVLGGCGIVEVKDPKDLKGFREFCFEKGVWNRPFSNFAYIMPAYIIGEDDLNYITSVFKEWFER